MYQQVIGSKLISPGSPTFAQWLLANHGAGLESHWRLNEASGTDAFDLRENAHGVYTNGPVLNQTGIVYDDDAAAASFDGDNDFIELGTIGTSHPLQLANTDFTLSAFVRPDSGGDTFQRILDKSSGSTAANGYSFYIHTGGVLGISLDGNDYRTGSSKVTYAAWNHVAVVVTATDYTLVIDGVEVSGSLTLGSFKHAPSVSTNARMATWNHATAREYDGLMQDVSAWSRALSVSELASINNVGRNGP